MIIKTIQWNIGGAIIREEGSPVDDQKSYRINDLAYIVSTIKNYNPDIITFQETHENANLVQAKAIAEELSYNYYFNDIYDKSHLEDGQGLGQSIISRFPLSNHIFEFFLNPKLELIRPNGERWLTHNKGVSSVDAILSNGLNLTVKTFHTIPFRKYGVDPLGQKMSEAMRDMNNKIFTDSDLTLIQADSNYDDSSISKFLPKLFENGFQEIINNEPTTPKGRKYDHVIYKGLRLIKSEVISSALTDHYPIYSEFEI